MNLEHMIELAVAAKGELNYSELMALEGDNDALLIAAEKLAISRPPRLLRIFLYQNTGDEVPGEEISRLLRGPEEIGALEGIDVVYRKPVPLTKTELGELCRVFARDMEWIKEEDWQAVAAFSDFRSWIDQNDLSDDGQELSHMLRIRDCRVHVRKSCRSFWGQENVPNINDPDEETWA